MVQADVPAAAAAALHTAAGVDSRPTPPTRCSQHRAKRHFHGGWRGAARNCVLCLRCTPARSLGCRPQPLHTQAARATLLLMLLHLMLVSHTLPPPSLAARTAPRSLLLTGRCRTSLQQQRARWRELVTPRSGSWQGVTGRGTCSIAPTGGGAPRAPSGTRALASSSGGPPPTDETPPPTRTLRATC